MASLVSTCHVFIPVITPGYIDRIRDCFSILPYSITWRPESPGASRSGGIKDGWVFDEFQTYLNQHRLRRSRLGTGMPIAPILRVGEPEDLPIGFPIKLLTDFRDIEFERNETNEGLLDTFATGIWEFSKLFGTGVD